MPGPGPNTIKGHKEITQVFCSNIVTVWITTWHSVQTLPGPCWALYKHQLIQFASLPIRGGSGRIEYGVELIPAPCNRGHAATITPLCLHERKVPWGSHYVFGIPVILMGFPGGTIGKKKKKKNPPANAGNARETGLIPRLEVSLEHSNPLQYPCWRIPWTKEPGRLESIGSHRVRHDWSNLAHNINAWYLVMSIKQ